MPCLRYKAGKHPSHLEPFGTPTDSGVFPNAQSPRVSESLTLTQANLLEQIRQS